MTPVEVPPHDSGMDDREPDIRVLGPHTPATFELGQAWRETPQAELRRTLVTATYRDGLLCVEADLEDEDVFNTATAHNQHTWETGDVFEIFVRRDDAERYVEVHVTPDNVKLHLQFDDFEHSARIDDIAEVAADPEAIESTAVRTPSGWRATARVPIEAAPGDLLRVSFCRYDAARGRAEPVLSSSSPHPVLRFHRPWEWTPCRITE